MTTDQLLDRIEQLEARVAVLEGPLPPADRDSLGGFQRHSDTSRQAAIANYPRSGSQRARILDHLIGCGPHGATRQELAAALGMSDDSVRPRVCELVEGRWVVATTATRPTPLGEQAEVLTATSRAVLEREATTEDQRQRVSPAPVVSEAPGATRGSGHAPLGGQQHHAPGASETTALFDIPVGQPAFETIVSGPRNAIDDNWEAM